MAFAVGGRNAGIPPFPAFRNDGKGRGVLVVFTRGRLTFNMVTVGGNAPVRRRIRMLGIFLVGGREMCYPTEMHRFAGMVVLP
jgi:hypothetical protein